MNTLEKVAKVHTAARKAIESRLRLYRTTPTGMLPDYALKEVAESIITALAFNDPPLYICAEEEIKE